MWYRSRSSNLIIGFPPLKQADYTHGEKCRLLCFEWVCGIPNSEFRIHDGGPQREDLLRQVPRIKHIPREVHREAKQNGSDRCHAGYLTRAHPPWSPAS